MADLTQEQAANIKAMMANVQAAYVATNATRAALGKLIDLGVATCKDVQTYNLQVRSVYAYQASVAGIIKANGGQAPSIPGPIYVTWKGITGDQAANIDCGTAQLNGWSASGLGDYRVNPMQVEWRQGPTPSDQALVTKIINSATPGGGLGIAPALIIGVIEIVLIGVAVVVTAYIALKIVEALTDVPGKVETTKQVGIQAEQNQKALSLRADCYTACTAQGTAPTDCARNCDRLYPSWKPTLPAGSTGIIATVGGVAVLGLLLWGTYRFVNKGAAHRSARGYSHREVDDGDDDDDEGHHGARHRLALPAGHIIDA